MGGFGFGEGGGGEGGAGFLEPVYCWVEAVGEEDAAGLGVLGGGLV